MLSASEQPPFSVGSSTVLPGIQDLRGLGHEPHAAEHDDRLVGLGCPAAEFQRVALEIGHRMEQRRLHVVVAENDGVALDLEPQHLGGDLGLDEKLRVRQDVAKLLLQVAVDFWGCLHER